MISIDLRYKNGTFFDTDNDGIENINGVIDFTIENSIFNWQVNDSNLCTQWEVYSIDNLTSTTLCYGSQKCCNFINLQPSNSNWSESLYLYYWLYGSSYNNNVSVRIVYVDYNLGLENPFAEIYYSNWSSLTAKFNNPVVINIITKITKNFADSISAIKDVIINLEARITYLNDSPIPNENLNFYKSDILIGTRVTNDTGWASLILNIPNEIPGTYIVNVTYKGKTVANAQETINILPSFNYSILEIPYINVTVSEPVILVEPLSNYSDSNRSKNITTKKEPGFLITRETAWKIVKQDYIDKFITYEFVYVNESYYRINWKWNDDYVKDTLWDCASAVNAENCINSKSIQHNRFVSKPLTLSTPQTTSRVGSVNNANKEFLGLNNFTDIYFDKNDFLKISDDVAYIKQNSMPRIALQGNASFSGNFNPFVTESGSFLIKLEYGFLKSNGLRIKFGLNSTIAEFNNTKTTENLTYEEDNNKSRYLKLLKTSDVLNATIDLRGYQFLVSTENKTQYAGEPNSCYVVYDESDGISQILRVDSNEDVIDEVCFREYATSPESSSCNWTVQKYNMSLGYSLLGSEIASISRTIDDWTTNNRQGSYICWRNIGAPVEPNRDIWYSIKAYQTPLGCRFGWQIDIITNGYNYTKGYVNDTWCVAHPGSCTASGCGTINNDEDWKQRDLLFNVSSKLYPTNITIDSGNVSIDYSRSGKLNVTVSKIELNRTAIQNYLSDCTPDVDGYCYVPVAFGSILPGIIEYSNINITIANYPFDPSLDVGNDSVVEWNLSGKYNSTTAMPDFAQQLQAYLDNGTLCPSTKTTCDIPLILNSSAKGILNISNIDVRYIIYDNSPPQINNLTASPNVTNPSTSIFVTASVTDNVNVTDVNASLGSNKANLFYNESTQLYQGYITAPSAGNYLLYVNATDSSGLKSSSNVSVIVNAIQQEVSLTQSAGNVTNASQGSESILYNPSNPKESEYIKINVNVYNLKNVSTGLFNVELLLDSVSKIKSRISISPNNFTMAEFNWTGAVGNHTITIKADSDNELTEDNENNNELNKSVYVLDVTPPEILTVATTKASVGNNLKISVNATDNLNTSKVNALINGTVLALSYNTTSGMYENSTTAPAQGSYKLDITSEDVSGLVTLKQSMVKVNPTQADLVVDKSDIAFSPETPAQNQNITINVKVNNNGGTDANNFNLEFLVDDSLLYNRTYNLTSNSYKTLQFNWNALFENHTIKVRLDTINAVTESNETNNEVNKSVTVVDATAPEIIKVILPDVVYENSFFKIKVNISDNTNITTVNATLNNSDLKLSLNVSTNLYENSTTAPSAGNYTLKITSIDTNNLITQKQIPLTIYQTQADLTFEFADIVLSPINISENDVLTANVTVRNRGGTDANNFKVQLQIDKVPQTNNTLSLKAASTNTTQLTWTAGYGLHNLTIRIDPDNLITESNETNNDYNRTITVVDKTAPSITGLTVVPAVWTNQTTFNVSWSASSDTNGVGRYEYQLDYQSWISVGLNLSFIITNISDGEHIIFVRTVDVPGNTENASNMTIKQDTKMPNTPIVKEWHAGSNWTQDSTPFYTWTDPGDEGSGVVYYMGSLDGGVEFNISNNLSYSPTLATGNHTFRIYAVDAANQKSNWSNEPIVLIDNTNPSSPAVSSITHSDNTKWYSRNHVVFNWTIPIDNSGIYGYYYSIDKVNDTVPDSISLWTTNTTVNISEVIAPQITANGSAETNITGLSDGTWYFHIVSRDNAGNVGTNATHYTAKIDTKAPTITNFTPANNSLTQNATPLFKVDYIDGGAGVNVSSVTLTIDGNVTNATVNDTTLLYVSTSNLSKGLHTATIQVLDNATNLNTLSWQFSIGNVTLAIPNISILSSQGTLKIFEFIINNTGEIQTSNGIWQFDTNDSNVINSTIPFNLALGEFMLVYIEYNFSHDGNFTIKVNATAQNVVANTNLLVSASTPTNLDVTNLSILYSNSTTKTFEFIVKNIGNSNLSNINWSLNTGLETISANKLFNLTINESIFVYNHYDYSKTGDFIVTASSTDGISQDSEIMTIDVEDIEAYNLTVVNESGSKRIFEIVIKNNLNTNLTNVNWTFDTKNSYVINGTIISLLQPSEQMFVYIDYNFTTTGTFNVNASAINGSLTDSRNLTMTV
ncbi:hypothetical protein HYS31_05205 [Candidatus Woesearchaeota archaeon]|nr:hypothetical protein [Candidatus Woesearchaeota archaeon]